MTLQPIALPDRPQSPKFSHSSFCSAHAQGCHRTSPAAKLATPLLPETVTQTDEEGMPVQKTLLRASAWATTFSAGLELAKQGEVDLA